MEKNEYLNAKVTERQNVIKALRGKMWSSSPELLINYYETCIRSLFEYSHIPISTSKNALDRLQIIQNKTLRLCLGSDYHDSTENIHQQANMSLVKPRLVELNNNYFDKTTKQNENEQVICEIYNQIHINSNYKLTQHAKKRRTTCLDEYPLTIFIRE
jgi:hypothetical protein